jgi:hypothetical protein
MPGGLFGRATIGLRNETCDGEKNESDILIGLMVLRSHASSVRYHSCQHTRISHRSREQQTGTENSSKSQWLSVSNRKPETGHRYFLRRIKIKTAKPSHLHTSIPTPVRETDCFWLPVRKARKHNVCVCQTDFSNPVSVAHFGFLVFAGIQKY